MTSDKNDGWFCLQCDFQFEGKSVDEIRDHFIKYHTNYMPAYIKHAIKKDRELENENS